MRARHGMIGAMCAVVAAIGIAAPVSAASSNLLGGHGNFERPVVQGLYRSFPAGDTFDGWHVSHAAVSLGTAFPGVFVPPQGAQALVLDDAGGQGGNIAGQVCRAIPTIAGHHYRVAFLAGLVNPGAARIVVRLGSASAKVNTPPGADPAIWVSSRVTLRADADNASLCFTAAKVSDGAFPAIDAAKVVDLGA